MYNFGLKKMPKLAEILIKVLTDVISSISFVVLNRNNLDFYTRDLKSKRWKI